VNNKDFENLAREKSKNYKINKPPAKILANNQKKKKNQNQLTKTSSSSKNNNNNNSLKIYINKKNQ
jgi:hypothetical protein